METLAAPTPTRMACLALPQLLGVGDLNGAAGCFARDSCLLTPDATAIHGRNEIRPVLAQLIARRPRIEVEAGSVIVAGDAAYANQRWRIATPGASESSFEQTYSPSLVLRQIEGSWKVAIAALWGWGGS
jgi:ketosteroid isomerase-like protein